MVAPPVSRLKRKTVDSGQSFMPELPEVQTVVNTLAPHLVGARIVRVVHLRPDIVTPLSCNFAEMATGRRIRSIERRAKRIVFVLDDDETFYIHLGMSGRLTLEESGSAVVPHTHLILEVQGGSNGDGLAMQVRFRDPRRFGGVFVCDATAHDQELGPEPLTLPEQELGARLARTTRAIKNSLLDQRLIAGLGNIYVDESLHAAKIHPLTRADKLSSEEVSTLCRSIKSVLRKALKHRGSTLRDYVDARGGKGAFQKLHAAYDREGLPCPRCGSLIRRIVLGGRSTCFCPTCQVRKGRPARHKRRR